jgi:hypothetical protein
VHGDKRDRGRGRVDEIPMVRENVRLVGECVWSRVMVSGSLDEHDDEVEERRILVLGVVTGNDFDVVYFCSLMSVAVLIHDVCHLCTLRLCLCLCLCLRPYIAPDLGRRTAY